MTSSFSQLRVFPRILAITVAVFFAGCGLFQSPHKTFSEVRTAIPLDGRIAEPFGLAVKGSDVFISDGQKGIIWKLDANGNLSEFAKGLETPSHISFGANGVLFVADSGDHTIKAIDPAGQVTVRAGNKGKQGFADGQAATALFNAPVGIVCLREKIFVADTYNDAIRVIEGKTVRTLAGKTKGYADNAVGSLAKFDTPTGLATAGDNLLVADTGNRRIRSIAPDGATTTIAGGGSGPGLDGLLSEARFMSPVGIAVDQGGTVYVADGDSIRAVGRRFIPLAETISGEARAFFDGRLGKARFNRVSGLAVASDGNLFVADSDNGLVRTLTGNSQGKILSRKGFVKTRQTAKAFRESADGRWPYNPAKRPREIAGTLGEIRGEIKGGADKAWFHNGLDIVGGYGEEARLVRTEKILRPLAVAEFKTKRENVRFPSLGYIHIRLGRNADGARFDDSRFQFQENGNGEVFDLRIPRGSKFKAGEVIGTLNTMNHVHLIAGPAGHEMNALDALILPGSADSRSPVIESVRLYDGNWREHETVSGEIHIKGGSKTRIVVDAYDQMDGNADRRRLGLYKLGYQLLQTSQKPAEGFEEPKWTIEFDRMPSNDSVGLVYAEGSSSGATGTTVFRYIVSNRVAGDIAREGFLDFAGKNGEYLLRVFAADYFGNVASKDLVLTIAPKIDTEVRFK